MVFKLVVGDLLEAKENLILHQVNCQGKMNSGIAKQIREKYPQVYTNYMEHWRKTHRYKLLGKTSAVEIGENQYIVNMYSQLNYGYDGKRYTNYEAIFMCLEKMYLIAKKKEFTVALPKNIGCDRGGASWKVIYAMIEEIFKDVDVTIYEYKGEK